jgi:benzoate-CoA ligase family protein
MTSSDSAQINASEYYLDRHIAGGNATRLAIKTVSESWTYGQLLDHVKQAARTLRNTGVTRGDRVILMHPDTPQAVAFLLAAMRIGAAPAPIPTQLTEDELAFICKDCEPAVAVIDSSCAERMRRIPGQLNRTMAIIVTDEARLDPGVEATVVQGEAQLVRVDPDEVALLQYTSGSTGTPKGVVHLHQGLLALPVGFGSRLALTDTDICYSAAKLSFGYGLGNSVFFPMAAGATVFLRAAPSDPVGVLEAIQEAQPTVVFAGPTLYGAMAAIRGAESAFELSSVRLYVSAGDMLSPQLFGTWQKRFGRQILDGLGSTECLHIFMSAEPGDAAAGEVGRVIPPYDARLLDDDGQVLPPGNTGQLEVRGPANFARYWNRPTQTDETIRDGWVRTGDVLHQSLDGIFSYVGRRDDIFKVREMKVSPVEIEQLLIAHPAVAECAVVGRPDNHGFPSVCAFIRLVQGWQGSPELEQTLRRHVRGSLSPHKVPKTFEFVTKLPRTSTGKLTRHMLRTVPLTSSCP